MLGGRRPAHSESSMASLLWFDTFGTAGAQPRARLLCLPFAGGSSAVFHPWRDQLPPGVQLLAARLPGRGGRFHEPLVCDLDALAGALLAATPADDGVPLVMFGHSMGALLAYELCLRLEARGHRPAGLIVSGCAAPGSPRRRPDLHRLPEQDFIEHLREINGTPAELIDNRAVMLILLPILRADFELVETYGGRTTRPVSCALAAIGGDADPMVTSTDLAGWSAFAGGAFEQVVLPGDHFFLNHARAELLRSIGRLLGIWCQPEASPPGAPPAFWALAR